MDWKACCCASNRLLLIALNCILPLVAGTVGVMCLWLNWSANGMHSFADEMMSTTVVTLNYHPFTNSIWTLAGVSGVVFLVSFLGCAAAAIHHRRLLLLYASIVIVCAVVQLSITSWIVVDVNRGVLHDAVHSGLQQLRASNSTDDLGTWIYLEKQYGCCGVVTGNGTNCAAESTGCTEVVTDYITKYEFIAAIISYAAVVIEVITLVLAGLFANVIHKFYK